MALSPDTQAILLLTAPLIVGRSAPAAAVLTADEYTGLVRWLRATQHSPADLLAGAAPDWLAASQPQFDPDRLKRLLSRGFLLSQALEHWQARAIWVLSRADADYPRRLKLRLRDEAPAVLYGCGAVALLNVGGVAVVGARSPTPSGRARGLDPAALRGALQAGDKVIGVLADGLAKASLERDYRAPLLAGRLVLLSATDPGAEPSEAGTLLANALREALTATASCP